MNLFFGLDNDLFYSNLAILNFLTKMFILKIHYYVS